CARERGGLPYYFDYW
nr:immunoglobulin heavy chain junction region [Mus musculus]MBK4186296.1 immunoglobulin heavy chain junction region [Mus musculus]